MQPTPEPPVSRIVRRPTVLELKPRRFRIVDSHFVPIGQDMRWAGFALMIISIALFLFLDININFDPMLPMTIFGMGLVGILIVVKAPLRLVRDPLLDLNLSEGTFHGRTRSSNGSGSGFVEWEVAEVDELLFAMRDVPVHSRLTRGVSVDGFAVYVRMAEGDLVPVVEGCFDHARTFRVAKFLSEAFDVGIKQVGKGWRS